MKKNILIGIGAVTGLIGLGSLVYSKMPDKEYRVELNIGVNATVQRYERDNITSVSIKRDDWIIDSNHDFIPDFRRTFHYGLDNRPYSYTDKPLAQEEIEIFNEAVNKSGIRQDD